MEEGEHDDEQRDQEPQEESQSRTESRKRAAEIKEGLQHIVSEIYAALHAGDLDGAEELRQLQRSLELELDNLKREQVRQRALARARRRAREGPRPSGRSSGSSCTALALLPTEDDLNKELRELQDKLEHARFTENLEQAVQLRNRMQQVNAKREEMFGPPQAPTLPMLTMDAAPSAAPSRQPRVPGTMVARPPDSSMMLGLESIPDGLHSSARRFFVMQGELEDALDLQDWEAALELRRRLSVFEEDLADLKAVARPRAKRLRELKEELERALDGREFEKVRDTWKSLKEVSAAIMERRAAHAAHAAATPKRRLRKGPPHADAQPEPGPSSSAPASAQGSQDVPATPLLAHHRVRVEKHMETLRHELDLLEWSLSMAADPQEAEEQQQRQRELERELEGLEEALRSPNPNASPLLKRIATMPL